MKLVLCRHGNTFGPDDIPVWTGSSNDLPLVEKGLEQAKHAGQWLKKQGLKPSYVYASHLIRVKKFADIIHDVFGMDDIAKHDERLNEIDYGAWTGITDAAVVEKFGQDALDNWRNHSQFPPEGQWGETKEEVVGRVASFIDDMVDNATDDDVILVVSSNGILRYCLKALDKDQYEKQQKQGELGVKTGRLCVFDIDLKARQSHMVCWNKNPADDI